MAAGTAIGVATGIGAIRRARRRARLGSAAKAIGETIMPSTATGPQATAAPVALPDEVHAPGHRHLDSTDRIRGEELPPLLRGRPWARHRHGLPHPGRG